MFVQRFSATRRGARLARLLALQRLDAWGIPYGSETSDNVGAVVGELSANAVLHGRVPGRDFELALSRTGGSTPASVLIEVTDSRGEATPPPAAAFPPDPDAESGRGLLLVEALTAAWGVRRREPSAPGKTIWARCTV